MATNNQNQKIRVHYSVKRKDAKKTDEFLLDELIETKGWKSIGNKLSNNKIRKIELLNGEELKLEDVSETKSSLNAAKAIKSEAVRKKEGKITSRQGKEGGRSAKEDKKVEPKDLSDDLEEDPVQSSFDNKKEQSESAQSKVAAKSDNNEQNPKVIEDARELENKESGSGNAEVDQKVEKIKSVQKRRKVKNPSGALCFGQSRSCHYECRG